MPTMATQLPPSMQNAFSRGYIKAGPGQSGCHSILYIYSWKRLIAISLTTWLLLRSGHVYPSLIMPRKKMGEHRAWVSDKSFRAYFDLTLTHPIQSSKNRAFRHSLNDLQIPYHLYP